DRGSLWTHLEVEAHWIRFGHGVRVVARLNFVFIQRAFAQARNEQLPDTAVDMETHRMPASVPMVKVANDTHALCTWGPHGKANATNTVKLSYMRSQFFVYMCVCALSHQVLVIIVEGLWKTVGIFLEMLALLKIKPAQLIRDGKPLAREK